VRRWLTTRHRRLLFRSYFVLAGGLLIVAALLEFGYSAVQERETWAEDPWLESTFRLIESELAAAPAADRAAFAVAQSERLGREVQLLELGDIAGARTEPGFQELVADDGQLFYLWKSPSLGGAIRLGPFEPPRESVAARLVPVFFYASILVLVGLWLRPLLKDVRVLTDASQRFAADYREPLATAAQTTELTSLANNLDDMSARISQLIQTEKEMTAALSHEMRTPLARIRFAAAVLGNDADAETRAQLAALNADVQQIDDLISDMLEYARLDHPGLRMQWSRTALEPWLTHVLGSAAARDRVVTTRRDAGVDHAWMEPRLMELALSNLVTNALRYAKRSVAVTLSQDAEFNRIVVEDDGEGIPDTERQAIFRAFTRLDTSRNRDTGGFGLGLAIVARIAALHRGRVTASNSATLGGARLELEWPAGHVPAQGIAAASS
jgi:signal transduction histidine kinase